MNEKPLLQTRYAPVEGGQLKVEASDGAEKVPVPIWDPEVPEARASEYSYLSRKLDVTLEEGDMLYLPAMWYHKVKQTSGKEGFACAVNYWYDMSFEGSFWASNCFVRDAALAKERVVRYPDLAMGDEGQQGVGQQSSGR